MTSKILVIPIIYKFGVPMEDGSNNSSINKTTSPIQEMVESLRSSTMKMVKAKMLELASSSSNCAKSGPLIMLIKLRTERPQDSMFHIKSILDELSSLDLDFLCREYLLLLVEETW